MTKLVGLHPEQHLLDPPKWAIPGQGAIGAPPPLSSPNALQAQPSLNGLGAKISFARNPRSEHQRNPQARGYKTEDYLNRAEVPRNYWSFNTFPTNVSLPLTTYSCRLYWTTLVGDQYSYPNIYPHIITFLEGGTTGTDRFSLMLDDSNIFAQAESYRLFIKGETNNLTSPGGGKLSTWNTFRIEIQVQPTTPKLTVNVYLWDATSPWRTVTTDPPEISADTFMLGVHPTKSLQVNQTGLPTPASWVGDVEVFDTYDLDGTVGQHYQTKTNRWYEIVNGQEVEVEEEGTVVGSYVDTTDTYNWDDHDREFIYSASNYIVESFYFDAPRFQRSGLIYHPDRTPPGEGWPLVIFVHGGFFSGGTLYDYSTELRNRLLQSGVAFASVGYILGTPAINAPLSLGVWPNANSGRYPSFYICAKLCALYLKERGLAGTGDYPINTDKICITGHSAGAMIALGAAVSRDLNALGDWDYDLTVNNPTYGYRSGVQDPEFTCAYVWSPPTDMLWAAENDPTHPHYALVPNDTTGIIKSTTNTYIGDSHSTTQTAQSMNGN